MYSSEKQFVQLSPGLMKGAVLFLSCLVARAGSSFYHANVYYTPASFVTHAMIELPYFRGCNKEPVVDKRGHGAGSCHPMNGGCCGIRSHLTYCPIIQMSSVVDPSRAIAFCKRRAVAYHLIFPPKCAACPLSFHPINFAEPVARPTSNLPAARPEHQ